MSVVLFIMSVFALDIFGSTDDEQYAEDTGLLPADIEMQENTLYLSGAAYLALSRILLLCGPRGPYNTFKKCPEFFLRAMSYPDTWFRCLFRCVYSM